MFELLVSWHLNYLLHSTALLLIVWALDSTPRLRAARATREALWRIALLGALFSASLQMAWTHGIAPRIEAGPTRQSAALPGQGETRNGAPFAGAPSAAAPLEQRSVTEAPAQALAAATPPTPTLQQAHARVQTIAVPTSLALRALSVLWLIGAAISLLWLATRWWRLRRLAARLPEHQDARLQTLLTRLTQASGQVRPRLLAGPWPSPLVAPGGAICLPAWIGDKLDAAQCEAVLGHELAHLSRSDPAWRLLSQSLLALGWLQPLNRPAVRRLDELAELACDGWSARRQGQGRSLAESLLVCAEHLRQASPLPAWVPAMAGRRSTLTQRIHHLLDDHLMHKPTHRPRWLIPALLAALGAGAIVSPVLVLGGPAPALAKAKDLVIGDGGSQTVIVADDARGSGWSLHVRAEQIEFNAGEDQLTRLQGTLKIRQSVQGQTRSLRVEGDGDDRRPLQIRYAVNDQVQTPDAQGQAWMREALHRAADMTIGPEERAQRLLAKGGLPAAFDWIEQRSDSDFQRRAVLQAVLETSKLGPLDAASVSRVIKLSQGMSGDFDRRETLNGLIEHQTLDAAQQKMLLQSLDSLHGDFDRRQVLEALNPSLQATPEVAQAWMSAVVGIGSDFERRTVIENLADREHLSPAQLDAALAASAHIGADFERRTALIALLPQLSTPAQLQTYMEAARHIGSDFDRRQVLVELIERDKPLDKASSLAVLSALQGMGSSFDLKEVLCTLAMRMPQDPELLKALRERARSLPSFERGQVEQALDERG